MNIWELEALIFADIETFNKMYYTSYKFKGDPTFIKEPKERLKAISSKSKKKYKESHCPEIFDKLDIKILQKNCASFHEFLGKLDAKLK